MNSCLPLPSFKLTAISLYYGMKPKFILVDEWAALFLLKLIGIIAYKQKSPIPYTTSPRSAVKLGFMAFCHATSLTGEFVKLLFEITL